MVNDSWLGVIAPAKMPDDVMNAPGLAIADAVRRHRRWSPHHENMARIGNEPAFRARRCKFAATACGRGRRTLGPGREEPPDSSPRTDAEIFKRLLAGRE